MSAMFRPADPRARASSDNGRRPSVRSNRPGSADPQEDGPSGPYAVNITCENPLSAPAGPFDFTIEDGETVANDVDFNDTCTVTETDDLGADSVTYACAEDADATCVDAQTVAIDVSDAGGEGTVTVTNTFDPEVVDEEPDTDADVVTATPSFTG